MELCPLPFVGFPKIGRLNRTVIVTEKIDGTNAQVFVADDGNVYAGSRTRWIKPGADNFGFAAWVEEHTEELRKLGPGAHFGEWYGAGIQRNYGLTEKRFALFNVERWGDGRQSRPACCGVVPRIAKGTFAEVNVPEIIDHLRSVGSYAVPGFTKPEGVVVFHAATQQMFKVTLEKDEQPKGLADQTVRGAVEL